MSSRAGLTARILLRAPFPVAAVLSTASAQPSGGPLPLVQGHHAVMEGPGRVRVDLSDAARRVAALEGALRGGVHGKLVELRPGQHVALRGGVVMAFRERDPWHGAQFRGQGDTAVRATRGSAAPGRAGGASGTGSAAPERNAVVGDALNPGEVLKPGAAAWAQIGFTGGGCLRPNGQSELGAVSVQRTSQGREVLLRLARGAVFRVAASTLVKVFGGRVAIPGQGNQPVAQGQEGTSAGPIAPLTKDAVDRFNQTLDAQRARPLTLDVGPRAVSLPGLAVQASSEPGAGPSVTIAGRTLPLSGEGSEYRLNQPEDRLPGGSYRVEVQARRATQSLTCTQTIFTNRTPPALGDVQVQRAEASPIVAGTPRDASPALLTVSGADGALHYPDSGVSVELTVRDAGNESRATLH